MAGYDAPIFIGGAGRSGTTLIADMMGLHPKFSPVYETDFVAALLRSLGGIRGKVPEYKMRALMTFIEDWASTLPRRPHNKRKHERYMHGPHHVLFDGDFMIAAAQELMGELAVGNGKEGIQRFVYSLFDYHAALDKKPRWVNKTPGYINLLPEIYATFPNMRFIHCVRDGRDVAASVMTRPWGPNTPEMAAQWWVKQVRQGLKFQALYPGQYYEIRYEDMLTQPERTLSGLFTWLGESISVGPLLEGYFQYVGGLDGSRCGAWKTSLSEESADYFAKLGGEYLSYYGYMAKPKAKSA